MTARCPCGWAAGPGVDPVAEAHRHAVSTGHTVDLATEIPDLEDWEARDAEAEARFLQRIGPAPLLPPRNAPSPEPVDAADDPALPSAP